eukprot:tig00001154_g7284.t1
MPSPFAREVRDPIAVPADAIPLPDMNQIPPPPAAGRGGRQAGEEDAIDAFKHEMGIPAAHAGPGPAAVRPGSRFDHLRGIFRALDPADTGAVREQDVRQALRRANFEVKNAARLDALIGRAALAGNRVNYGALIGALAVEGFEPKVIIGEAPAGRRHPPSNGAAPHAALPPPAPALAPARRAVPEERAGGGSRVPLRFVARVGTQITEAVLGLSAEDINSREAILAAVNAVLLQEELYA